MRTVRRCWWARLLGDRTLGGCLDEEGDPKSDRVVTIVGCVEVPVRRSA